MQTQTKNNKSENQNIHKHKTQYIPIHAIANSKNKEREYIVSWCRAQSVADTSFVLGWVVGLKSKKESKFCRGGTPQKIYFFRISNFFTELKGGSSYIFQGHLPLHSWCLLSLNKKLRCRWEREKMIKYLKWGIDGDGQKYQICHLLINVGFHYLLIPNIFDRSALW